jgi:hypothetical protein
MISSPAQSTRPAVYDRGDVAGTMQYGNDLNRRSIGHIDDHLLAYRPEPDLRRQQVFPGVTEPRLFREQTKGGDKTNHHSPRGVGTVTGDMVANLAQICLNMPAEDIPAHRGASSAIRRAMTSSPSTASPEFTDATRSAMAARNSATCLSRTFVSGDKTFYVLAYRNTLGLRPAFELRFNLTRQIDCHYRLLIQVSRKVCDRRHL